MSDWGAPPAPAVGLIGGAGASAIAAAGGTAIPARPDALPPGLKVILYDARAADAEGAGVAIDALAGWCADGGTAVVVVARDQIDLVAPLIGGANQLLCGTDDSELAAAVSLALAIAPQGGSVRDPGRESEAEQLRRLNDEVARIAEMLARLSRGEPGRAGLFDRPVGFVPQPDDDAPIAPAEIRHAIRLRRLRDQFFGTGLFEEPAWDMLLDLFAAELEGARVSVSSLCIAAAVAPTTALRWIARLTDEGLLLREPDPLDRRRAFMRLSEGAQASMAAYWRAARRIPAP